MSTARTHKDVEFHVGYKSGDDVGVFHDAREAALVAVLQGMSGAKVHLDVCIFSRAGARWYGGAEAAEQYDEDPDASVFERIEISVNNVGRVP